MEEEVPTPNDNDTARGILRISSCMEGMLYYIILYLRDTSSSNKSGMKVLLSRDEAKILKIYYLHSFFIFFFLANQKNPRKLRPFEEVKKTASRIRRRREAKQIMRKKIYVKVTYNSAHRR